MYQEAAPSNQKAVPPLPSTNQKTDSPPSVTVTAIHQSESSFCHCRPPIRRLLTSPPVTVTATHQSESSSPLPPTNQKVVRSCRPPIRKPFLWCPVGTRTRTSQTPEAEASSSHLAPLRSQERGFQVHHSCYCCLVWGHAWSCSGPAPGSGITPAGLGARMRCWEWHPGWPCARQEPARCTTLPTQVLISFSLGPKRKVG